MPRWCGQHLREAHSSCVLSPTQPRGHCVRVLGHHTHARGYIGARLDLKQTLRASAVAAPGWLEDLVSSEARSPHKSFDFLSSLRSNAYQYERLLRLWSAPARLSGRLVHHQRLTRLAVVVLRHTRAPVTTSVGPREAGRVHSALPRILSHRHSPPFCDVAALLACCAHNVCRRSDARSISSAQRDSECVRSKRVRQQWQQLH